MENGRNQRLKELEQRRDEFHHRVFVRLFEIFVIFGAPAAIAFFVGGYFDGLYEHQRKFKIIALAAAFVISWAIMAKRYIQIDKQLKAIDKAIKEERNKNIS
ncbi:MAG: hypothetical protein Q8Q21_01195 [bacterium]|nr:hypothetical protein [bacterium]